MTPDAMLNPAAGDHPADVPRTWLRLIAGDLESGTAAERGPWLDAPSDGILQVERGVAFAWALAREPVARIRGIVEPILDSMVVGTPSALRVVDRNGHSRPVYRPLLSYCLTQAFRLVQNELAAEQADRWRTGLLREGNFQAALTAGLSRDHGLRGDTGGDVAERAWIGLALTSAATLFGQDARGKLAEEIFDGIRSAQQPGGAFLRASAVESPEITGYHELLILHAVASHAGQTRDAGLLGAVKRNARFQLAELQPDHATNQPWSLFAFLLDAATYPMVEGLLHTSAAHLGRADPSPLSLMLLADALYCANQFWGPPAHDDPVP